MRRNEQIPEGRNGGFAAIEELLREWEGCARRGATVWWAGNGGSRAVCEHASSDLQAGGRTCSMVLGNAVTLSAATNDHGQNASLTALARRCVRHGDILLIVSSSGESDNVVHAAKWALTAGARVSCLTAHDRENRLQLLSEAAVRIHVATHDYGLAEIAHMTLLHEATRRHSTDSWIGTMRNTRPGNAQDE